MSKKKAATKISSKNKVVKTPYPIEHKNSSKQNTSQNAEVGLGQTLSRASKLLLFVFLIVVALSFVFHWIYPLVPITAPFWLLFFPVLLIVLAVNKLRGK